MLMPELPVDVSIEWHCVVNMCDNRNYLFDYYMIFQKNILFVAGYIGGQTQPIYSLIFSGVLGVAGACCLIPLIVDVSQRSRLTTNIAATSRVLGEQTQLT